MQETSRQVTGPEQPICVLHWPYRKLLQHTFRKSHVSPVLHRHEQGTHAESQNPSPQPDVQVQRAWQSM